MAIVKVFFRTNCKRVIDYVKKDMDEKDIGDSHRTTLESAAEDFKAVQQMHNMKGENECVHIVQSWHKKERNLLSPSEFNELGKNLAAQYFPGHQFIVVTHTGTENIHNHIVVNTMNLDTGKKIDPKYKHLHRLRDLSDEIIAEKGLSIVNSQAKEREAKMPQTVQQMMKFNKHSWLLETKQKSDFVRQFATSYDEYASALGELGVTVQIEPKNITYFSVGRSKGKRGSKMGKPYDKPGLEKAFRENDEKFREKPWLKAEFSKAFAEFSKRKDLGRAVPSETQAPAKDYSAFTKRTRDQVKKGIAVELQDDHSLIPVGLLRKATTGSLFDYCKRNRIEIEKDKDGVHRLKGRDHVRVTDSGYFNEQNRGQGNLVDFVRLHKNMTYIQAVAHLTNSPQLLLLEKHFGKVPAHYKSFYVPKENSTSGQRALNALSTFLRTNGVSSKTSDRLLFRDQAHVTKEGSIRLFPENDSAGCFEFQADGYGKYIKSKKGVFRQPFFSASTKSKKVVLFLNPFTLMQKRDGDVFHKAKTHSILALMEPDAEHLDLFVAHNPHTKSVQVVFSGKKPAQAELDFFNVIKGRLSPFGISVETVSFENALRKEGLDLSL